MNEVTRTMLFVCGLPDCTQREVLRDHPRSLSEAISGARAALRYSSTNGNQRRSGIDCARQHALQTVNEATSFSAGDDSSSRLKKLTQEERACLLCEGKCFACWKAGYLARNCTRFKPAKNPNAEGQ